MEIKKIEDDFYGGCIDRPDPRDYLAEHILGAEEITIPDVIRLDIKEGNQGADPKTKVACTCFAAYHAAQYANELEHNILLDPDFIKGWDLQGEFGTRTENGDYVQTALKSIVKNGLHTTTGNVYPIEGYAKILHGEIDYWLARGYMIVTSAPVTSFNFVKAKTRGVWGGLDSDPKGGHAFVIVGKEKGLKWASNSYGSTWGKFGDGTFKILNEDVQYLGTTYILYDKKDMDYLYKDITSESPSFEAIKLCKEMGILTGYADGRFGPNDSVTREQIALIVQRLVDQGRLDKHGEIT